MIRRLRKPPSVRGELVDFIVGIRTGPAEDDILEDCGQIVKVRQVRNYVAIGQDEARCRARKDQWAVFGRQAFKQTSQRVVEDMNIKRVKTIVCCPSTGDKSALVKVTSLLRRADLVYPALFNFRPIGEGRRAVKFLRLGK